ncbi:hypothetical protein [Rubritalea halochordaticola]
MKPIGEVTGIFSCAHCGFAHWFMDVEASIPAKTSSCPQHGWSWEDHS